MVERKRSMKTKRDIWWLGNFIVGAFEPKPLSFYFSLLELVQDLSFSSNWHRIRIPRLRNPSSNSMENFRLSIGEEEPDTFNAVVELDFLQAIPDDLTGELTPNFEILLYYLSPF
ncbi:hypothetical protein COLO4_36310 [Corchorus olitorius]|uniref:Uncharacterized protein n=1 Tax=Corchorus olitorius TaxID=93759 RepID=A0A1R3GA00_9ROSI|nr:hypothetical protein COLO4_36310 [Corchorus olitorius]